GAPAHGRLRVLFPAGRGAGRRFRRPVADRLARLRREGPGPPGPVSGREDRRLHPHRHAGGRRARAGAPGPAGAAERLAAVSPAARPPLHLVDASLYVFRAWHSMPDEFHDADGWPTNAVHGFARFLLEVLERDRPRHIVVAFDEAHGGCFRNALYPDYKANRPPAPDPLKRQVAYCRTLCMVLGLPVLAHHEYEADDLIGSALRQGRALGHRGVIVSADKDRSQRLEPGGARSDFARGVRWGRDAVHARHGVHPGQIADYLALCGDAIDNIPGVPGIGARTAAALLAHFGSLDALLERIDEVPFLRLRGAAGIAARLREHRE